MGIPPRSFDGTIQLTLLTEAWRKTLDSGFTVAVAFIDFKKAFDSVSHSILLTKLEGDLV